MIKLKCKIYYRLLLRDYSLRYNYRIYWTKGYDPDKLMIYKCTYIHIQYNSNS